MSKGRGNIASLLAAGCLVTILAFIAVALLTTAVWIIWNSFIPSMTGWVAISWVEAFFLLFLVYLVSLPSRIIHQ